MQWDRDEQVGLLEGEGPEVGEGPAVEDRLRALVSPRQWPEYTYSHST
jgi:hypothetical protein